MAVQKNIFQIPYDAVNRHGIILFKRVFIFFFLGFTERSPGSMPVNVGNFKFYGTRSILGHNTPTQVTNSKI